METNIGNNIDFAGIKPPFIVEVDPTLTKQGQAADAKVTGSIQELMAGKQDELVSGENIKTINGESILGSGDIQISVDATMYQHWIHYDYVDQDGAIEKFDLKLITASPDSFTKETLYSYMVNKGFFPCYAYIRDDNVPKIEYGYSVYAANNILPAVGIGYNGEEMYQTETMALLNMDQLQDTVTQI